MQNTDRHNVRSAFTLVEILVACGIIGVLIAMLFPALAKVRAQSIQLQCAANLRSWGQAFHIYADQSRGFLPHSQDESANPVPTTWANNPAYPQNECSYIDLLPPLMSRPSWSSYANYQKPTDDIWQCPLAQVLPNAFYDYAAAYRGYHSYCMNEHLDSGPLPMYPPFLNLARCRHGSVTLLMLETTLNPAQAYGQNSVSIDCNCGRYPDSGPEDLGDRHPHRKNKLGANILMLDGHVEWTDSLWDDTSVTPVLSSPTWMPY